MKLIAFITFFIALLFVVFYWYMTSKAHTNFERNELHIKLNQSKWFRRALAIPLVLAGWVGLIIFFGEWDTSRLCFTGKCFYNLYEIYRFPIWLAGLSLALSGIVAAVHRSNETAKQISTAQKQYEATLVKNSFDLFVKHQEVFVSGISDLLNKYNNLDYESNDKIIVDMQYLYSEMFNNTPILFEGYYAKKDFSISKDSEMDLSSLYFEAKDGQSSRYVADMVEHIYRISHENLHWNSYEPQSPYDLTKTANETAKFAMRYCDFCTELFSFLRNTFIKSKT